MTLMLMAVAAFAVGLLPGYAVLGICAAVLLVVLKLVAFKATLEVEAVAAKHPKTGEDLRAVGPAGILKARWRPIVQRLPLTDM